MKKIMINGLSEGNNSNFTSEEKHNIDEDSKNMELILESLGSAIWSMDLNEFYEIEKVHWSDNYRRLLGYKNEKDFPNELESWSDLLYGDDRDKTLKAFYDAIYDLSGQKIFDMDFRMYTADRGVRWFHAVGRLSRREDGSPITFVGLFKDIDIQKIKEDKLKEQMEIVEALSRDYKNIYKINLYTRSARVVKLDGYQLEIDNDSVEKEYSYDALMRMYIKEKVHPEDQEELLKETKLETIRKVFDKKNSHNISYRLIINEEVHFYQLNYLHLQKEKNADEIILAFKNIDNEVMAAREKENLRILSETDTMTGVLNRGCGERRTIETMPKGGMFCILDVDHFKHFNDTYGHEVGDKVIIALANSLKAAFREEDIVYRLGGDEFAVFAKNIHDEKIGERIFNRLTRNLEKVTIPEIGEEKIRVSMGARIISKGNDISFTELYKTTDDCAYKSKKIESDALTFYKD